MNVGGAEIVVGMMGMIVVSGMFVVVVVVIVIMVVAVVIIKSDLGLPSWP